MSTIIEKLKRMYFHSNSCQDMSLLLTIHFIYTHLTHIYWCVLREFAFFNIMKNFIVNKFLKNPEAKPQPLQQKQAIFFWNPTWKFQEVIEVSLSQWVLGTVFQQSKPNLELERECEKRQIWKERKEKWGERTIGGKRGRGRAKARNQTKAGIFVLRSTNDLQGVICHGWA